MKAFLFSFNLLVCIPTFCIASPPVKKVHAFKQASIPGIVPHLPQNETQQNEKRKQKFNYWFYMEIQSQKNIQITGLWLDGVLMQSKKDPVQSLPVKKIIYSGGSVNDTVTMVPVTRNQVILVSPSARATNTIAISKYLQGLISSNELVISYTCNGKKYYATAKKIRMLAPDAQA